MGIASSDVRRDDGGGFHEKRAQILEKVLRERLPILFVPRLRKEFDIDRFIKEFPGGLFQVVIEEAEHVSHLATSYRPEYVEASQILKTQRPKVVLCYTDTTSPALSQDICDAFMIPRSSVMRSLSHLPTNLELRAVPVTRNHDKFVEVLRLLVCRYGYVLSYRPYYTRRVSVRTSAYSVLHRLDAAANELPLFLSLTQRSSSCFLLNASRIADQAGHLSIPSRVERKPSPESCKTTCKMQPHSRSLEFIGQVDHLGEEIAHHPWILFSLETQHSA